MTNSGSSLAFVGKSSRDVFGVMLIRLAESDDRIVAVTADVPDSVRLSGFRERWPDRFFNFGVAEQNMMGAAAGLARAGRIPYVSLYAIFGALRATEQVRTDIAYANLPARICVSHSGISLGPAGSSHHSLEDLAIFRSIPNMTVVVPADGVATAMLLDATRDQPGPVYMRMSRATEPTVYAQEQRFPFGMAQVVRPGNDIAILACGASVGRSLQAAAELAVDGISAMVVDVPFIKPIDKETVIEVAKATGTVLTVEEHTVVGGLGSAVAEVLAEARPGSRFKRLGIPDCFTFAGPYPDLLKFYKLDSAGIAANVRSLLSR